MTTKEFTFWLEGYIIGGGNDIKVIQDKAATIKDIEPNIVPYVIPHIPYLPEYYPSYPYITCTTFDSTQLK